MFGTRTVRWTVGAAVLCVLLAAASWFLLISPRRSEAADLNARNVAAEQENQQLQLRIEELKAQSAQLPSYRAELSGLLQQLPPTTEMPQLVRDLNALASASGVTMDSLTPGNGVLLSTSASSGSTSAPAPASGSSGSASAPASGSASGSGSAADGSAAARADGVVQVPLTVVVHGDYFQTVGFLQRLQTKLTRAVLVTGVQVAQNTGAETPGTIQLTITGSVFVWPAGAQATATPTTTPSATSGGTSGATSGATSTASLSSTPVPASTASDESATAPTTASTLSAIGTISSATTRGMP